jgi:deoxyribodipyrimidine photo-lyase
MSTAVVWFRRDLRLADNPALAAACAQHARVLPVFLWAPEEEAPWAPGAAARVWLHHSLAALAARLAERGAALVLRRGPTLASLLELARATGAQAVYWNRLYEPALRARDEKIKSALRESGLQAHSFKAALLAEPWELATGAGEPYRVFTPFWRALEQRLHAHHERGLQPLPEPQRLAPPAPLPASLPLAALELLPKVRWDEALIAHWQPGEAGAWARLERFCAGALGGYKTRRDFPAEPGTSRLSPHLHFGEISPAQIAARVERVCAQAPDARAGAQAFLRQLGWREFAHHLLYHYPQTPEAPLNARHADFPWRAPADCAAELERWRRGRTGIPIVDAGMRELWATGYLHNRVRMIVASLLIKNLLVSWQEGARWFWDTLVDADLANNTLGWQWVAGCGADAAPYFRIFNPVLQSQKFDPEGAYLQRWVPELAGLQGPARHAPWTATAPPRAYPAPLCDLAATRTRALAAYARITGENAAAGPARPAAVSARRKAPRPRSPRD